VWVKRCKTVFLWGTSYSLVQILLPYRVYRLATVHFVTDRRTDDSGMPTANPTAWQYDRLTRERLALMTPHSPDLSAGDGALKRDKIFKRLCLTLSKNQCQKCL